MGTVGPCRFATIFTLLECRIDVSEPGVAPRCVELQNFVDLGLGVVQDILERLLSGRVRLL